MRAFVCYVDDCVSEERSSVSITHIDRLRWWANVNVGMKHQLMDNRQPSLFVHTCPANSVLTRRPRMLWPSTVHCCTCPHQHGPARCLASLHNPSVRHRWYGSVPPVKNIHDGEAAVQMGLELSRTISAATLTLYSTPLSRMCALSALTFCL
jgi:hypothetical protein